MAIYVILFRSSKGCAKQLVEARMAEKSASLRNQPIPARHLDVKKKEKQGVQSSVKS